VKVLLHSVAMKASYYIFSHVFPNESSASFEMLDRINVTLPEMLNL